MSMPPFPARHRAQLKLLCPVQDFDRSFALGGLRPALTGFAVDQPERPAAFSVSGPLPGCMLGHAPVEIIGDASIERFVRAFENIDRPVHSARFL